MEMIKDIDAVGGTACIITAGLYDDIHAKTAHGLVRQSDRFKIIGIIDEKNAGADAGILLDGVERGIMLFPNLEKLINANGKPEYAIIGMATKGGVLPEELNALIEKCLRNNIMIINGLHQFIGRVEKFAALSTKYNTPIYDIRQPKPFDELSFWSGKIKDVTALKLAVIGTDCAIGKRTTTKFLINELKKERISAHMIYTGQTGWMQGSKYGFIFDATPNDFISGEMEAAVYDCWKNESPEVIILEGQSALRNPSGPCGSEFIISCALDGVFLQHDPGRKYYKGLETYGKEIGSLKEELELIRLLGSRTLAVALNTANINEKEAFDSKQQIEQECGVPVIIPLIDGVGSAIDLIKKELR